jgi:hypothetical protein
MKINKKRAQVRLRDCWPNFLRDFLKEIQKSYSGKYQVIRNYKGYHGEVHITFNFEVIECKDIYALLARILERYDTKGFLNMLTEKLAEISNLAFRKSKLNDIQTRGRSIYRGINRYRAMTI